MLSLCFYFARALRLPHPTRAGVEHRLFGLGDLSVKLMESSSGGQWVLVSDDGPGPGARGPASSRPAIWQMAWSFEWAPQATPPRRLAPFQSRGTWQMEGGSLRRVWSRSATGWLGEIQLWVDNGWGSVPWVLDVRRGRERQGNWGEVEQLFYEREKARLHPLDQQHSELASMLSSPLEELPPEFSRGWESVAFRCGGTRIYLAYTTGVSEERQVLYAGSDDLMPRILPLARNAWPLALSRDGRTLFFRRRGALWRLDFRKPLPELLSEVPVPILPELIIR
jgi:hypothetical protein